MWKDDRLGRNKREKRKERLNDVGGGTVSDSAKTHTMDNVLYFELRSPVSLKRLLAKNCNIANIF